MPLHKLDEGFHRKPGLKPGRYSDGGNLYLKVGRTYSMSWVFMYSKDDCGRRREMSFGPVSRVSLSAARKMAAQARRLLAEGMDPYEAFRKTDADGEAAPSGIAAGIPPAGAEFRKLEIGFEVTGLRRLGSCRWEVSGWMPPRMESAREAALAKLTADERLALGF